MDRRSEYEVSPRVSIIGANGFIGRWLAKEVGFDHWRVDRYDLAKPAVAGGRIAPPILESDYIFWLASRTNPAIAASNSALVELEFDEFACFVRLLEQSGASPTVLLASSGGTVYDTTYSPPYSETSPLLPRNPYAQLKVRMEGLLESSRIPHAAVRMANPYGPGQPRGRGQGVVAEWVAAVAEGRRIPVIGSLETKRDFIFVQDAVRGLMTIAACELRGTVNLGSGVGTPLGVVLDTLRLLSPLPLQVDQQPARVFDAPSTWLAIDRLVSETDWHPVTSLEEGLRETLLADTSDNVGVH
jgi:UDP-glucose 4-epimerase